MTSNGANIWANFRERDNATSANTAGASKPQKSLQTFTKPKRTTNAERTTPSLVQGPQEATPAIGGAAASKATTAKVALNNSVTDNTPPAKNVPSVWNTTKTKTSASPVWRSTSIKPIDPLEEEFPDLSKLSITLKISAEDTAAVKPRSSVENTNLNGSSYSGQPPQPTTTSPLATPEAFAELRSFMRIQRHSDIFAHCMGISPLPGAPPLADWTILRGCDGEKWTRNGKLTEFGTGSVDTQIMATVPDWGDYGINLLLKIVWDHWRVKPNAHLINNKWCIGDPASNRFGNSVFADFPELGKAVAETMFVPFHPSTPDEFRPLVILGHDLGNDLKMLDQILPIGNELYGIVVAEIDTQKMAWELGYRSYPSKIGLGNLVTHPKIDMHYRDEHTATNDTAMMMIAAVQMVLPPSAKENAVLTVKEVVDEVEAQSKFQPLPKFGVTKYCLRCGQDGHAKNRCQERVWCNHCKRGGHATAVCVSREFALARQATVADTDDYGF